MREKDTLKATVYQIIMNGILSDEYKPNQIITERELIEKCGFSKSPIREALLTLCNENVLLNHPRYGYEVIRLTREDVTNILEFRYILEGALLTKSYHTMREDEIQSLVDLDSLCKENTNMWEHWETNTRFHLALASYAKNPYASAQLSSAMTVLKRAYAQFYWQTWTTSTAVSDVRFHEDLIHSIKEKQLDKALAHLQNDLNDFGI